MNGTIAEGITIKVGHGILTISRKINPEKVSIKNNMQEPDNRLKRAYGTQTRDSK